MLTWLARQLVSACVRPSAGRVQLTGSCLLRQLTTMKLSDAQLRPIFSPELTQLAELFRRHGYQLRIAGGAVRDILSGKTPQDLDFATTATPDQMKAMFTEEAVRMINTKGEKHGTITARINDTVNFEVTTLRIDVTTDGRHAEVEFTTDWELDAGRRDLTVNAMFLGLDGTVYDYFSGQEDLKHHRVRFVGDPVRRIQEDYLRILRYFRFYGRLAASPDSHESETLTAIRENVQGLANISGERLWMELKKILAGRFSEELTLRMLELGIGPYVGLPDSPDTEEFSRVCQRCRHLEPNPITLLAALLRSEEEMLRLHGRLKLSAFERDLGVFITLYRHDLPPHPDPLARYKHLLAEQRGSKQLGRLFILEVLKYRGQQKLAEEFGRWQLPRFPVTGTTLKAAGVPVGKHMSRVMNRLRQDWMESDFTLTEEQLSALIPGVLQELGLADSAQT